MLTELYGRNFGCFRDEFKLSMLATEIDRDTDRGIVEAKIEGDSEPLKLLRAIALYGPNGSGKSTVLRAAGALRVLLANSRGFSSEAPIPSFEPFALGTQSKLPVSLGVKAIVDGRVYDYSIAFDASAFVSERLIRWAGDTEEVLVDRSGQNVQGAWTADPQFKLFSQSFRQNALLLSLADSLAPKLAQGISVGLNSLLTTSDPTAPFPWVFNRFEAVAKRARDDTAFGGWLLGRLQSADVGVVDMRTEEVRRVVEIESEDEDSEEKAEPRQEVRTSYRLALMHGGSQGPVPLPYSKESLGTRRIVELAPLLYDLAHGARPRAAFVDEFDASMHPVLLEGIIRHFNCEIPMADTRGQLIFAAHETTLLDGEAKDAVLRRDQVYFTEKDSSGAGRLYSVAEFKERNNLNIRRRYLQGRYGALPSLGTFTE